MGLYFRIAELAKLYGLNSDTLRYYEELGLLHPRRGENRYREYSVDDLCELNIIRSLRELGVGMEEIRQHLCAPRTVAGTDAMLASQEEILLKKIAALQKLLTAARQRRERLKEAMERPVGEVRRLEFPARSCVFLREKGIPEPNLDYLLRKLLCKLAVDERAGVFVIGFKYDIIGNAHSRYKSHTESVLGNKAHADALFDYGSGT